MIIIVGSVFCPYLNHATQKSILPETSRDTLHDLYTCISDLIIKSKYIKGLGVRVMVFNSTSNNI
jgi:hypothetical protein